MAGAGRREYTAPMKIEHARSIIIAPWALGTMCLLGLALTGCVVEPDGRTYVAPAVVEVAPEPVYVGPEVVVPIVVGGGHEEGRRERR